jgi:hypothetical protein
MKLLRLVLLFVCGLAAKEVFAQWDRLIFLTNDDYGYDYPQILVDDSLRLHVFAVRVDFSTDPITTSQFYQRFDNWGNPLCPQMEMLPDSHLRDYGAGVIMDRNQVIHIAWGREFDQPWRPMELYARMNTQGEFLTPPTEIMIPNAQGVIESGINMVQDCTGIIWVSYSSAVMAFSENGDIAVPLHLLLPPTLWAEDAIIAVNPLGQVWACFRLIGIPPYQNISIMRVDTADSTLEFVSTASGPFEIQMTQEAFYIDTSGAFHYILYRDDSGLFYQRDPRSGSPRDTVVFDQAPYGIGSTYFTLVGTDTLQYMWGQTLPADGLLRVGFSLSGDMVLGPLFLPLSTFFLYGDYHFAWKRGGYWVIGNGTEEDFSGMCMIHVPGPEEPPNAVRTPRSQQNNTLLIINIYPQPVQGLLNIQLPFRANGAIEAQVFNILGQHVTMEKLQGLNESSFQISLPTSSAAGTYYLSVRTGTHTFVTPFIHIP